MDEVEAPVPFKAGYITAGNAHEVTIRALERISEQLAYLTEVSENQDGGFELMDLLDDEPIQVQLGEPPS